MKKSWKKFLCVVFVLGAVSVSSPAEARSYVQFGYHSGGHGCSSQLIFKGYTRCGCPRYAERYIRYYDRHGCPVYGYRFLPVRHQCYRPSCRPYPSNRPHC